MYPISGSNFISSAAVHWSMRGVLMSRRVIDVLCDSIGLEGIFLNRPYFKTILKVAACLLAGLGMYSFCKRLASFRTEKPTDEPKDSLDSPVFAKKKISPLEVSPSVKEMPLMGFGTFIGIEDKKIADLEVRRKIVEESVFSALQAGCRHLDCASGYNNLKWIGNALKKAFLPKEEGGLALKREDIWITSRDPAPNIEKLGKNLEALGVDYLDLYLIHLPEGDIRDLWTDMNAFVEQGFTNHIGVSNFYRAHLQQLIHICEKDKLLLPYANEVEISPWVQENKLHDYCNSQGVRLIAYSPLGYGNSAALLDTEKLVEKAKQLHATAAQVALAWNMARGISVIPSSRNQEHIQSNCDALRFVETLANDSTFMQEMQEGDMNMCSTETANLYKEKSLRMEREDDQASEFLSVLSGLT